MDFISKRASESLKIFKFFQGVVSCRVYRWNTFGNMIAKFAKSRHILLFPHMGKTIAICHSLSETWPPSPPLCCSTVRTNKELSLVVWRILLRLHKYSLLYDSIQYFALNNGVRVSAFWHSRGRKYLHIFINVGHDSSKKNGTHPVYTNKCQIFLIMFFKYSVGNFRMHILL